MRNPAYIHSQDLQHAEAIREHIADLIYDYSKTRSKIILDLIQEWKEKYKLKLIEENA